MIQIKYYEMPHTFYYMLLGLAAVISIIVLWDGLQQRKETEPGDQPGEDND